MRGDGSWRGPERVSTPTSTGACCEPCSRARSRRANGHARRRSCAISKAIQRFAAGSGPFAFFDAPWTPVFLAALFAFHWQLGLFAVLSGCALLVVALCNQAETRGVQREAAATASYAGHFVDQMRAHGETVHGLGMQNAVVARAAALRDRLLDRTLHASDRNGFYGVLSKTLRLFLQSMMLGLGAWLAIRGEVTAGVMIAASILLGRALAPIDQAVAQWPMLQRVLESLRSLAALLDETPPEPQRTVLPAPRALLEVEGLTVAAPGARRAAVRGASFRLGPGQAAGIAGRSASGKSTLARALAGVWPPIGGAVRLDGAELEQYGADLGRHVGYLPQEVALFDGTVAENIARLATGWDDAAVVDAAKRTGAHEMILSLPDGYDFRVSAGGAALSGGQRQRIALARAFYGAPALVVMDEPDSNLDADGTMALAHALAGHKRRGGAAVVVAHRHGAFAQCDTVYIMQGGRPVPAGPEHRRGAPVRSLQSAHVKGGRRKASGTPTAQEAAAPAKAPVPANADADLETRILAAIARIEAAPRGFRTTRRARPGAERRVTETAMDAAASARRPLLLGTGALGGATRRVVGLGRLRLRVRRGDRDRHRRGRGQERPSSSTATAARSPKSWVRDGTPVESGDLLLRFSDTLVRAEEAMLAAQHADLVARRNRLEGRIPGRCGDRLGRGSGSNGAPPTLESATSSTASGGSSRRGRRAVPR